LSPWYAGLHSQYEVFCCLHQACCSSCQLRNWTVFMVLGTLFSVC